MKQVTLKILGVICALTLLVSMLGVLPAAAITGGGKGTGTIHAWGCDMSYFNVGGDALKYSMVDFNLMKADGCDYVILRIGYEGKSSRTDVLDPSFIGLYNKARAAGMGVGLYFYALSTTYNGAVQDAKWVMNIIESNNMYFDYPLYYDVEDSTQTSLGSSAITNLCLGWCETLENAGYFGGVYGGQTQVMNKLTSNFLSRYDTWIAYYLSNSTGPQYDPEHPVTATAGFSTTYGMWQYKWLNTSWTPSYNGSYWQTSDGYPLDCNVCYKDYPSIMYTYGYNNCSGSGPAPTPSTGSTAEKLGTYMVTASTLNVRWGASTSYGLVTTLTSGDLVTVSQLDSNGWGYVTTKNGISGWCAITSYGEYIGVDALNTELAAPWGAEHLSVTTASNGSVTFVNNSATDGIAVDMPLPLAIGTRTTPYLNMSVSVNKGGWYVGLTQTGSGYFMMRECTSDDQLVEALTATYMTTDEALQIDLSEWWKPADGWRIDNVRLYLKAGTSITVNYCYFADAANVVTTSAYNMRVGSATTDPVVPDVPVEPEPVVPDPINLLEPSGLYVVDRTKTGSYNYYNGVLTVTSNEANGYEVAMTVNKSFKPEELSRWLLSVESDVRFDIELLVTTSDGERTFSMRDDFYGEFTSTPDGDYIPPFSGSAGLGFLGCYTWNNVLPADGVSTVKKVTIRAGGVGTVKVNALQLAANDSLTMFTDDVWMFDSTPDAVVDPTVVMGDVTGDGKFDTKDARTLLSSLLGGTPLTSDQQAAADYDGTGSVTTADVRAMLVALLG